MYIHSRWNDQLDHQKFLEEEMEFPLTLGGNHGEALRGFHGLNSPETRCGARGPLSRHGD